MHESIQDCITAINRLRKERRAVILAHTYQPAEVQDIADYVDDSYGLSAKAAAVKDADLIVFCGVQFMAETAAILNPGRKVIMPDPSAGCPMADMITAEKLRAFKAKHPGAPVVCYVNSTAEVKAESDICCTSANAVKIVKSLGDAPEIIFVPDQFLGKFVEKQLGRRLLLWEGCCPIHHNLGSDCIARLKAEYPDAKVMVHPETPPDAQAAADYILSTGQMIELVKNTKDKRFLVGTEDGIIHALRKAAPHCDFILISPTLRCPNMKKTTLPKIRQALESGEGVISVDPLIAAKAKKAIDAMLEVSRRP
ncbi:MAG: quinolinate synthase NadA [Lentisphaeria bacterium]|jgi:quinolinate synthase